MKKTFFFLKQNLFLTLKSEIVDAKKPFFLVIKPFFKNWNLLKKNFFFWKSRVDSLTCISNISYTPEYCYPYCVISIILLILPVDSFVSAVKHLEHDTPWFPHLFGPSLERPYLVTSLYLNLQIFGMHRFGIEMHEMSAFQRELPYLNYLSKCAHFTGLPWLQSPIQSQISHSSVTNHFQSPISMILTDLSGNQLFCAFQAEISLKSTFELQPYHQVIIINNCMLAARPGGCNVRLPKVKSLVLLRTTLEMGM